TLSTLHRPSPTLLPSIHTLVPFLFFFFFNHTATTEIYTLSLHDALPIFLQIFFRRNGSQYIGRLGAQPVIVVQIAIHHLPTITRSEEHTSELQSLTNLVCRLLLEKKKKQHHTRIQRHRPRPHQATLDTPV